MRALKLNYKRTFLIGFAFFGILLLWQVYDSWCPTFLTDIFANRMYGLTSAELKLSDPSKILNVQWLVGIIMACDNLAALILLPIFGRLSDKTKTPIGKRMPFILIGTVISAIAFPFIPLFFHNNSIGGMYHTKTAPCESKRRDQHHGISGRRFCDSSWYLPETERLY